MDMEIYVRRYKENLSTEEADSKGENEKFIFVMHEMYKLNMP